MLVLLASSLKVRQWHLSSEPYNGKEVLLLEKCDFRRVILTNDCQLNICAWPRRKQHTLEYAICALSLTDMTSGSEVQMKEGIFFMQLLACGWRNEDF